MPTRPKGQRPSLGGVGGSIGIVAFLLAAIVPMQLVWRTAPWLFLLTTGGVYAAAFFGPDWNHAHRWISIGGYSFQPVDFARLALILATARAITIALEEPRRWFLHLFLCLGPAGVLAFGLFQQPDKGNALLVTLLAVGMVAVSGVAFWSLIACALGMVPVLAAALLADKYSRDRIDGFFGDHPFQVRQSLQAFEHGGLVGEGIGGGWHKMGHVPEAQNDFVFAIVGEELGFLGSVAVLAAFTLFGVVCFRLALKMQDPFHRYVVLGCSVAICAQALINMLVTTGAAPAKGIDLPFVSSGGTNLMASFGAVGLIGNAARADRVGEFAER